MSEIFKDREKALEDEYIRKKDQEALDKMRAEIAAEELAKDLEKGIMHCPRCDGGTLVEMVYEGINVNRCDKCQGWWLDAGELEQITHKNEGFIKRFLHSLSAG